MADRTETARMTARRRLRLGLPVPGRRPAVTNGAARNAPAAPGEQPALGPAAADGADVLARRRRPLRARVRPATLAAVAAGGALGTPARYLVSRAVPVGPGSFPWTTFWINVSGSFALGVLLTLIVERWPPTRFVRSFAAIGFLGAYTTFSTFGVEADRLVSGGHPHIALAYVAASLGSGLVAVYAGVAVARTWPGGGGRRR